jgi:ribosomal protein L16 Arg81 hydroxylase
MPQSLLDQVLKPVSVGTFLKDYFGVRPLLVRGARDKFHFLLRAENFMFGLDRVREVRCVFSGLKQATISPSDIKEMFEAGATICVTGMERAHSTLQRAAKRIESEIGYAGRVDFRAYLSPPGSGFDIHYDARVATTLQIDGTKTWWYSDYPHTPFPTENSPRDDMEAIARMVSDVPLRKATLRPGDLLCLPAGAWHKAKAGRGGSLALNMAFNHSGATVVDVLIRHLRKKLTDDASYRSHFFAKAQELRVPGLDAAIQRCIDALRNELDDLTKNSARALFVQPRKGGARGRGK